MRNDFTLFLRSYPNGRQVYFYYTYDKDGRRRGPWTTHSLNKTEARNYYNILLKKDALIPDRTKGITFAEYSVGFWERGSEYIKYQESRGEISDAYINNCRTGVVLQINTCFGDMPLDKITHKDVNTWLLGFKNKKVVIHGREEVRSYQNTYVNGLFSILNVMLTEAVRRDLIPNNPCDKVKRLKNDRRKMAILTVAEVQKLFPKDYKRIWGDKFIPYVANRLGSLTGMRIGEVMGLRGEYVFDNYIHVCGQYNVYGYKDHTKTRENRNIPLLPEMIDLLKRLMKKNGKGFVFSLDGGATPVSDTHIRREFHNALDMIGINDDEIGKRRLTFHSWRHFVNTDLLRQGLTIKQVQSVTGHKSEGMTDRYNHPDATQIDVVTKAQAAIAGKKQPEKTGKGKKTELKIVKISKRKTA